MRYFIDMYNCTCIFSKLPHQRVIPSWSVTMSSNFVSGLHMWGDVIKTMHRILMDSCSLRFFNESEARGCVCMRVWGRRALLKLVVGGGWRTTMLCCYLLKLLLFLCFQNSLHFIDVIVFLGILTFVFICSNFRMLSTHLGGKHTCKYI